MRVSVFACQVDTNISTRVFIIILSDGASLNLVYQKRNAATQRVASESLHERFREAAQCKRGWRACPPAPAFRAVLAGARWLPSEGSVPTRGKASGKTSGIFLCGFRSDS